MLSLCPSAGCPPHPGAIHTGCCPSKNATSFDGPQAVYGGHPGSQQHWQPEPSLHSARTTEALAEAPPRPWSGCSRTSVMERPYAEHPEEPTLPHVHPCPVSLAKWHYHGVVLDATEQAPLLECGQHSLPGLKPGQALDGRGGLTAMPKQPSTSRAGPHRPDILTRKGAGTLTRAPFESMMLMASSLCRCPTS